MISSHTCILMTFHFTTVPDLTEAEKGLGAQLSYHEASGSHGGYTSTTSVSWWTKRRRWLHVPTGSLSPWISVVISKLIYKSDWPRQGTLFFFPAKHLFTMTFLFCTVDRTAWKIGCVLDLSLGYITTILYVTSKRGLTYYSMCLSFYFLMRCKKHISADQLCFLTRGRFLAHSVYMM